MTLKITIKTEKQGESPLVLETSVRTYARYCALLCEENKLECIVTEEREPRVVTFKNM